MKLRKKESFESYKAWQQADGKADYRKKISDAKNELKKEQQRYNQLDKQKRNLYSGSDDFDKTKQVKEDFEQCEKNIEQLQKKISDLEDEAQQAELNKQKLRLAFLKDAAEYSDELLEEFISKVDEIAQYYQTVRHFTQFDSLRIPGIDSEFPIYWGLNRNDNLLDGFKERHEAIVNDNFQPRELTKLKNEN